MTKARQTFGNENNSAPTTPTGLIEYFFINLLVIKPVIEFEIIIFYRQVVDRISPSLTLSSEIILHLTMEFNVASVISSTFYFVI